MGGKGARRGRRGAKEVGEREEMWLMKMLGMFFITAIALIYCIVSSPYASLISTIEKTFVQACSLTLTGLLHRVICFQ